MTRCVGVSGWDGDPVHEGAQSWTLFDCIFTDGEGGSGDNDRVDIDPGFALLNCENVELSGCSFPDEDTLCRVVMRD